MTEGQTHPQPRILPSISSIKSVIPGLSLCVGTALVCVGTTTGITGLSPLLLAIIIGVIARNTLRISQSLQPGISFSAKSLLRWGVVLLGLQLSIPDVLALGPGVLVIVIAAVTITFVAALLLGKALKVEWNLTVLIASGFSICGAAAIAGMQGIVRARDEIVAAAIALVVLFGTLMIPITTVVVSMLHLEDGTAGTFIGGSVHEVAQVVAAAGIAGGAPLLAIAVPIKLARVLLMAPMVTIMSLVKRRTSSSQAGQKKPPLVPRFVLGFIAMILVATTGVIPPTALEWVKLLQQFFLTAAMFALGLGVHIRSLMRLGLRPILLSLLATLIICMVVAIGISLGLGAQNRI